MKKHRHTFSACLEHLAAEPGQNVLAQECKTGSGHSTEHGRRFFKRWGVGDELTKRSLVGVSQQRQRDSYKQPPSAGGTSSEQ